MIEQPLRMPPDIVIRPSGVWDSRAPLHDFLSKHKLVVRTYNVLTLAVYRLRHEATDPAIGERSGRYWIRADVAGVQAGRSWGNYRKTLPRDSRLILPQPKATEVAADLGQALFPIRRQTIAWYASEFETFTQCWALNWLLSQIEAGKPWSHAERALAEAFSPEHGSGNLPGLPRILDCFSFLENSLKRLAAFVTTDDSEQAAPLSEDVNALEAIRTWRAVRNLIVHRSSIMSGRFLDDHGAFFKWLQGHYPYMGSLEVGTPFRFYDDVVRSVFSVHLSAAFSMSDMLEATSSERRGHPFAPASKPDEVFFPGEPPLAPAMLLEGDHETSLRWTHDGAFRMTFRRSAPRRKKLRAEIESRVKNLRNALSSEASSETLRSATEALTEALQKAGSAVYGDGAEGAGVGAETATPGGEGEGGDEEDGAEEGTVEGEYREV